ncbi:DUF4188 domain-containing protein [Virgibacillus sp.]|uniref:DUF4188 domain-containing protein n=1 Tax=Virgibacillus sp. TaxID=1872700 RepID=UPI00184DE838|nr:DUF4188 domain-containing protein [Virgibacillus sp.]NWO15161.1 DUF4188 domain-containing protein [Virgibacillus sp.]
MIKQVYSGRYTTENEEDIVVFLIGMRVNRRLAVHKWLPVFLAMPRMIKELYTYKDTLGFLSMESYFGLRTTLMVQYWRSTEDLLAYAKGKQHLAAWKRFNQKASHTNAVGIYHETYVVPKGNYEAIYANMPLYGLAKANEHIPVSPKRTTAKQRLTQDAVNQINAWK